jgi:4-diphosphocytidyl-2-C-methyl-D-erythritol kinase
MPVITELARAKVNLTLSVLGRRGDGYHEIASLVAFARLSDKVSLDTDRAPSVIVSGPFAEAIGGANLVAQALELVAKAVPGLHLGRVDLVKLLPVAGGLGGGSADAAAFLRAVRRANPRVAEETDWRSLATQLGADVAVCLGDRTAWMSGRGERVEPLLAPLPPLPAVFVNPLAPVPQHKTARVFAALAAAALTGGCEADRSPPPSLVTRDEVLAFMHAHPNDLAAAAQGVVPEIGRVMAALEGLPGAEIVRVSGAGPTCFAMFRDEAGAGRAAATLKARHRDWWVEATTLAGDG